MPVVQDAINSPFEPRGIRRIGPTGFSSFFPIRQIKRFPPVQRRHAVKELLEHPAVPPFLLQNNHLSFELVQLVCHSQDDRFFFLRFRRFSFCHFEELDTRRMVFFEEQLKAVHIELVFMLRVLEPFHLVDVLLFHLEDLVQLEARFETRQETLPHVFEILPDVLFLLDGSSCYYGVILGIDVVGYRFT